MNIIKQTLLLVSILSSIALSAQRLTGHIMNVQQQPVPNASVYIREISLGLVADEKGAFRTQIKPGDYTMEISSVGFEKKIMPITIPEKGSEITIELQDKVYELQEVFVKKDNEDPAYRIMRNVIARSPYFYRQLKSYESDVYIKGSFKIEKIPGLLTIGMDKKELDLMVGKLFLLESQNAVKYTAPNKYEQHVVAIKSSIPSDIGYNDNAPLSMVKQNIYAPGAFSGLLSPSSFSVYKFSLEDSYLEDGNVIYTIKIIPKKKNAKLVNGSLNIVDGTWNIQRANIVENAMSGITANYALTYHEVQPGVFLPTSYDMSLNVSMMGIKGYGKFYSSVQYKNVETIGLFSEQLARKLNDEQGKATVVSAKKPAEAQKKQQQNLQKLEELASKDKLSMGEARKMAKLIIQTTETDEEREQKRNLNLTPSDSLIKITKDSLALMRDSTFWDMTRKISLNSEELQSYIMRDSLKTIADSLETADSVKNRKPKTWLSAFFGGNNKKINKKVSIDFAGIRKICPEYNFVDGFWLGQKLTLTYNYQNNHRIIFKPSAYYATARKTLVWQTDASMTYAPMRNGYLSVSLGNTSQDYAGTLGTNRFINSIASLVFAENTAKFYDSRFARIFNYIDVANGLRLNTRIDYEKRNELHNNTSFNFFKRTPEPNTPNTHNLMPTHQSFAAEISLEYTPRYYYTVREGRKNYSHSAYPTFLLSYKKALPCGKTKNSSYDK
jgi:hypothetical protein